MRAGTLDDVLLKRKITWKTLSPTACGGVITLVMGFRALLMTASITGPSSPDP